MARLTVLVLLPLVACQYMQMPGYQQMGPKLGFPAMYQQQVVQQMPNLPADAQPVQFIQGSVAADPNAPANPAAAAVAQNLNDVKSLVTSPTMMDLMGKLQSNPQFLSMAQQFASNPSFITQVLASPGFTSFVQQLKGSPEMLDNLAKQAEPLVTASTQPAMAPQPMMQPVMGMPQVMPQPMMGGMPQMMQQPMMYAPMQMAQPMMYQMPPQK